MDEYGPFVHLWGIDPSQLPSATSTGPELEPFLSSLLHEALPFIQDVPTEHPPPPTSRWKHTGNKTFKSSSHPVHLYERTIPTDALQSVVHNNKDRLPHVDRERPRPEFWSLRRSVHRDAAESGTASWDEWVRAFKQEHAECEKAFTPTVVRTRVVRGWDCSGLEIAYPDGDEEGDIWTDWTLKVEESVHALPSPLNKRVFPVLQATAAVKGRNEFLVVQIATTPEQLQPGEVQGAYTSVERVRQVKEGKNEWIMGTTSDARGLLPAWVQRVAVPGQVAKDVELFLSWRAREREKEKNRAANGGGSGN